MGQQNEGGESLVIAAVGSVVSVFIIIAIAIIILYFIKKKAKHGSSKPQSASHEMRNSIYMTNANETHGMEISDNNTTTEKHEKNEYACYPRDRQEQLTSTVASEDSPCYSTLRKEEEKSDVILNQSESQYMFLHYDSRANTSSTERQTADTESDYSYTSYPGKSRTDNEEASKESPEYYTLQKEESGVIQKQNASQSKYMVLQHDTNTTANTGPSATERESESEYSYVSYPMKSQTDNEEVPTDLPVSTLQKEQDNDVIDFISNVRVKPNNIDIVKQGGLQSGYMCLQQDGSIRSTTIVPPLAVHVKADNESDVESEYSYATYQGKGQNQTMPIGNADRSKGYTPKTDQGSAVNNTLNVRSLRNDDAYAELKLGVNDSNEGSYDTLNHLTRTRVPDDVIDDYNKLILTPEYGEESEEYTNLNMTFLKA
ncbi:uncharacterized protein LOC117109258 [Anneissia japonica]|uniref:uncharacterized protein LOC117109258 n=1 Tax=Anneissia japonica TaxID=1529436 RepID=UPI001425942F|nr:uncharacterized protein LOC117109258 [Anneissia japonica]